MNTKKKASAREKMLAATEKRSDKRVSKIESTRRNKFALEYAVNGGNATQAYITAGYSEKAARQCACRLLTNANVQKKVREYRAAMHSRLMMQKEEVLQEAAQLASFDPRQLLDEDGNLKHLQDMDDATAKSLQELELLVDEDGVTTGKVKFGRDKASSIEKLLRFYNAYEDHQKSGSGNFQLVYIHAADANL